MPDLYGAPHVAPVVPPPATLAARVRFCVSFTIFVVVIVGPTLGWFFLNLYHTWHPQPPRVPRSAVDSFAWMGVHCDRFESAEAPRPSELLLAPAGMVGACLEDVAVPWPHAHTDRHIWCIEPVMPCASGYMRTLFLRDYLRARDQGVLGRPFCVARGNLTVRGVSFYPTNPPDFVLRAARTPHR